MPEQTEELLELNAQAGLHLTSMVISALKAGEMPPRPVFEWFAAFSVEQVVAMERMIMDEGEAATQDPQIGATLERAVVSLAEVMRICDANKLLVVKDKIVQRLNSRRLRLPPDFDHTYQGLLSG